jgi:hypothetical protein
MKKAFSPFLSLAPASLLALLCGCGPYSFSPSVSNDIKTISVPLLENRNREFGISEALTQGIIDGFIADNTLKISSRQKADAVLVGAIVEYDRKPYTFDQQENVKEYIVRIFIQAYLEKTKDKEKVWEVERIEGWGTFRIAGDPNNPDQQPETEDIARERAIAKLAQDIINRTVKSW